VPRKTQFGLALAEAAGCRTEGGDSGFRRNGMVGNGSSFIAIHLSCLIRLSVWPMHIPGNFRVLPVHFQYELLVLAWYSDIPKFKDYGFRSSPT
jgi:hypothetical protein